MLHPATIAAGLSACNDGLQASSSPAEQLLITIFGRGQYRDQLLLSSTQEAEKSGPGCRAKHLTYWRARLRGLQGQPQGLARA